MEIKPIYDTKTTKITKNPEPVRTVKLESKIMKDPKGKIPNGIYKTIYWERNRQVIYSFIAFFVVLLAVVYITLLSTTLDGAWPSYVIPGFFLLASLWKLLNAIIKKTWIDKSIVQYRENLELDITTIPPFIPKLYLDINKGQVHSNWVTTFVVFYGGIFTLVLWWLKDVSWWIFDFEKWIESWFVNPDLMTVMFAIFLGATVFLQIVFTIYRKKRVLEINAYFGGKINENGQVENTKRELNKMYRRVFLLSVMIVFVIPFFVVIVKGITKLFKRK